MQNTSCGRGAQTLVSLGKARRENFSGTKLVLLVGGKVATLLRDDRPDIPCPNMWDFPGGGREGSESAEDCVLRETQEELSLRLRPSDLSWKQEFDSPTVPGTTSWWFAATLPASASSKIKLGNEGQRWTLMAPSDWLTNPSAIPHFKPRLRAALRGLGQDAVVTDAK